MDMKVLEALVGRTVAQIVPEQAEEDNEEYAPCFTIHCTDGYAVTVGIDYDDVEVTVETLTPDLGEPAVAPWQEVLVRQTIEDRGWVVSEDHVQSMVADLMNGDEDALDQAELVVLTYVAGEVGEDV